jgi:hypothetical protein
MFRVKYDMTEGMMRRVRNRTAAVMRPHSSSPYSRRRYGTATTSSLPPHLRREGNSSITNITAPQQAGAGMSQRYSPVFERAEDPTLAEDFMPADPQTQHKIFRNLIMFDPIAGPATEYWKDLAFSPNVILSGIADEKVMQFYQDAIEASGVLPQMPMLLSDYLTFGKFVFHMLMDERLGYWNETIMHDLDYVSIKVSPIPSLDPLIDIQPTQDMREWATSSDPRFSEQRHQVDPILVNLMAAGSPIPLAPENTMFMPRQVFGTDLYGTSYLTRVMPFKIYEKALLDASIAGARRRAGPLWHITVWPDATDEEMSEVLDLFFAAEEDPIGGKVLTREGVTVNPIGGGSADFWKLSDEWTFLSEAKMRALGISETFLSGEANYNSMDMILSTFLEKVRAVRALFTKKIIIEKIFKQLAEMHGFVKRSEADLSHGVRTGRKSGRRSEPEFQIPTVEWDKPLSPIADRDYLDILGMLEEQAGLPIPIRMRAQVAGFDIDKALDSYESDLETRKQVYEYRRARVALAEQYGFNEAGEFEGAEGTAGAGGGLEGFEGLESGAGGGLEGFDLGGGGGEGLGELGGGEEAPPAAELGGEGAGGAEEAPPAAPSGGEGGFGGGAATLHPRFDLPNRSTKMVVGKARREAQKNILKQLEAIPLWDKDVGLLGMSRRQVAKILDRIDHTDPRPDRRKKLAMGLERQLRRTEGLDHVQAEVVQYLAVRLGYVPPTSLSEETFDRLRKFIVGRMNGNGLTKAISNEIVMLSKVAEAGGRKPNSRLSKMIAPTQMMPRQETTLPEHMILTGVADLRHNPFYKG